MKKKKIHVTVVRKIGKNVKIKGQSLSCP